MKTLISVAVFLLPLLLFSQENKTKPLGKSFSVSFETMLFNTTTIDEYFYLFTDFECLLDTKNKTALIIGIGRKVLLDNWSYSDMAVKGEFNKLIGGKSQFFEVGAGLTYYGHAYMIFRLGYRGVFWKRLLVRIAYTPGSLIFSDKWFYPLDHMMSIGLGYRFGKNR